MSYRARFEALIDELRACPELQVNRAELGPPTEPQVLLAARQVAAGAWPSGMGELYQELSFVHLDYSIRGWPDQSGGAIELPTVDFVWDHLAHEDAIWFSDPNLDHPELRRLRPIDCFVPEQWATLYPVPGTGEAKVCLFSMNDAFCPLELSYAEWLELLLEARGAYYWMSEWAGSTDDYFRRNFECVAGLLGFDINRFRGRPVRSWIETIKPRG